MMSPTEIAFRLLAVVGGVIAGVKSTEDLAKDLINLAFDSGIAPEVLRGYLDARDARLAEAVADVAEEAKLAFEGMPLVGEKKP